MSLSPVTLRDLPNDDTVDLVKHLTLITEILEETEKVEFEF